LPSQLSQPEMSAGRHVCGGLNKVVSYRHLWHVDRVSVTLSVTYEYMSASEKASLADMLVPYRHLWQWCFWWWTWSRIMQYYLFKQLWIVCVQLSQDLEGIRYSFKWSSFLTPPKIIVNAYFVHQ
jgi:hypothetical protein